MGNGITMNEVIDRIPGNPGRVLITPEDGSMPYYATVVVADNPIQVGTPINKALFDSIQADKAESLLRITQTTGTNTYTAQLDGYEAYTPGQVIIVTFTNANTGASTLNINGLGARSIIRDANTALYSGEINAGSTHIIVVGDTNFTLASVGTTVQNANTATSASSASRATTANYWNTARTLTLTGDVTGSASIRGNANVSLATTLKAASGGTGTFKRVQAGETKISVPAGNVTGNTNITVSTISDTSKAFVIAYIRPSSSGEYIGCGIRSISVDKPTTFEISHNVDNKSGIYSLGMMLSWVLVEFN